MKLIEFVSREKLINQAIATLKAELMRNVQQPHAVMLSGGSTPLVIFQSIAQNPFLVDTNAVITYSDERYVPIDHKDNNYFNSKPMLEALKIAEKNILRVKTELEYDAAVKDFNESLAKFVQIGTLPLGFLGMGTDGHTASLFKLDNIAEGKGKMAIGVKKETPPDRISTTRDFLHKCERLIILLTGQEKRPILKTLLEQPEAIPTGVALKDHPCVEIWISD